MQLFYLPGSCAIAPHIALELSGKPYRANRLERGEQLGPRFLKINPLGRVPVLFTGEDHAVSEVPSILNVIADANPELQLLPPINDEKRYRALSWLAYFSSTVHPAFGRLWRAERFAADTHCETSIETAALEHIDASYAFIEESFESGSLSVGKTISAVDCYLFVFGRWGFRLPKSTNQYPNLLKHTMWMSEQTAVATVLATQNVTLQGPSSGPG